MDVLYAEDLARAKCDCPDCKTGAGHMLYLKPRCHVDAGLTVMHHEGLIVVACKACGKTVAQIAVAERPESKVDGKPGPG